LREYEWLVGWGARTTQDGCEGPGSCLSCPVSDVQDTGNSRVGRGGGREGREGGGESKKDSHGVLRDDEEVLLTNNNDNNIVYTFPA
jgi:hypothetical protein